jgi:hypothetical protein
MFDEFLIWGWMGAAIIFAIGGAAGFFTARQIKDKRTLELEQQLEAAKTKLSDYQADVNRHFLKTSLLFNKLTDDYREVYEHLATGAQKLCKEQTLAPRLELPDTKILTAETATEIPDNEVESPAIEPVAEESAEPGQETQTNDAVETQGEATAGETPETAVAATTETNTEAPAPESAESPSQDSSQITQTYEKDEEVHLGAESIPGEEAKDRKAHTSIH